LDGCGISRFAMAGAFVIAKQACLRSAPR
jgi:hypothetical protein